MLVVGVEALEVRPPLGLGLAAVVVEQLREQPARALVARELVDVIADAFQQRSTQRIELGGLLLVGLVGVGRSPERDVGAEALDRLGPPLQQPLAQ